MEIKKISIPGARPPGGHYSPAVVYGGLVFVSGQLPIDPRTGERNLGTAAEQTRQALENVSAILEAAGSSLSRVLKVTVYVADIELWGEVNEAYARAFGEHRPARAIVPTGLLHYGFLVEIEAVAAAGG